MKKMKKSVAVLLVGVMLVCGMAGCGQAEPAETNQAEKFTLYCGLNDAAAGEQILTVEEAQETARNIIVGKGYGYTEYVAYGGYLDGDKVINNDTLVYELMFMDSTAAQDIAKTIKTELNLDSVLMETSLSEQTFAE